jgi:pimeloyl-ACP methyl ester carboxylesterase
MINVTRDSLRVGNYTLHYTAAGKGHPVVLIHGLAGSSRWWLKNIPVLANHFRVYTLDLAGFGRSRGQSFALQEASSLVLRWMDAMAIGHCHVMGHSMGGYITATLVARSPERFGRVVLVDAVALPVGSTLPGMTVRLVRAMRYMPFDFLPVLASDIFSAGPVTMTRAIRDIFQADLTAELKKIQADMMIIWGEHDRLLPLRMGVEMHRHLPGAKFVMVPGAGHNPMWDRPQAFHDAVLPFLQEGEVHTDEKFANPLGSH